MISLEIKQISFECEVPPNNLPFSILVEIEIGQKNNDGADIFSFTLCNKLGLLLIFEETLLNELGFSSLQGYNIVICDTFQEDQMISWINLHLRQAEQSAKNWQEAALMLNKTFRWEYFKEYSVLRQ